ncbi:TenA family transcriptional regulator [Streptomyces sp. H10-C2]|uniref:TenA family protein n=1 Tax=unclassified Streptomyces TaxID=2593676 RepID=UPI0024B8F9DE|nr:MULTISPECIES: TenA family transcriptional regulator [unclassified Streptomyces]MDJ0345991.1 TenA family transcriptional regulator [Streptomyces sp. PH10-H1]MDJ0370502.1 TenA family transcriptional regulator [Streptomyces sp. H10-C2]
MSTQPSVRSELAATVTDGARRISEHPYYRGLKDGTLPGAALVHFTLQDSCHLLPSYGRAHARCAALAGDSRRAALLSRMATGALEDCAVRLSGFAETAERLGLPYAAEEGPPPVAPATLGYVSFLGDSCAASIAAGIGALVPSAWLYLLVTDDLLDHHDPGARYASEVRKAHPGDFYREMLDEFLDLADEIAAGASAADRRELVRRAGHAVRYEWAFVDAAWRMESWPF